MWDEGEPGGEVGELVVGVLVIDVLVAVGSKVVYAYIVNMCQRQRG